MRCNMNANIEAELARKDTSYSWELSYESTTQMPFGDAPTATLWMAITNANDALNSLKEEEDFDEDSYSSPEITINRYIGGEYDADGRFTNYERDGEVDFYNEVEEGGFGFDDFEEVIAWAESQWDNKDFEAQQVNVMAYIAYCNKLKEAKVGIYANA